ncbi:MAG TPA: CHAT domain-containing tetratricopeptide repeat protein, partial [Blastocatellia bacterium]|nr:CHAT domain-containing tetratricopeptide repeat protein [Blastocatellia bacterium]
ALLPIDQSGRKNPRHEAYFWKWTGDIYMRRDPNRALLCYRKSLRIQKEGKVNDPRGEAQTLDDFGATYYRMGKNQQALDYFRHALELRRKFSDREGESLTLYNIARIERDLGDLTGAREHVDQAIKITESLRTNVVSPDLRASYFASVRNRYELRTDILMRHGNDVGREESLEEAFESSDNLRGRRLLELLSESRVDIKAGVSPQLLEQEKDLLSRLEAKTQARIKALTEGKREAAANIEQELSSLEADYRAVEDNIKQASPKYAALTHPSPLSLKEIQKSVLDPDTILLEYLLADDRSYMWVVTDTAINGFVLPGQKEIEPLAKDLLGLLSSVYPTPAQQALYWRKANQLSKMVLGPAEPLLNRPRIVVVADGALEYVPFAALPIPGDSAGESGPVPMMVKYEISNQISASALAVLRALTSGRQPAPKSIAAFANPIFDLGDSRLQPAYQRLRAGVTRRPVAYLNRGMHSARQLPGSLDLAPLPGTQYEADAIERLIPDKNDRMIAVGLAATREAAMSPDLAQYRIIHLATHGFLDYSHPEQSGIFLSMFGKDGAQLNGLLNVRDIYNLNLPADLVVLSACSTALGKDIKGEGLVGLTQGFLYAGAARVVASLWRVDDTAAAELMSRFYEKIFKEHMSPAAALRAAQISMWKDAAWKSPSYWAAFVLQGEWK